MDTDWCLRCGRQTCNDTQGYCSKTCMASDRSSAVHAHPFHIQSHRPNFDVPSMSPLRHSSHTRCHTRREARACTLEKYSKRTVHNSARFRDEELSESQSGPCVASRYTGRDRDGILVWAQDVFPGLPGHEEESFSPSTETSSMSDFDRFLAPLPPFPLTAQNLAPPCVTIAPRHALLNHTSTHYPSNPEDRTTPSLSLDDASLLTPATDSVITPSAPSRPDHVPSPPPKTNPRLGSLINKVCTWIVSPSRLPRASSEGNPSPPSHSELVGVAVHSDETASCCYVSRYGDKSSAEAVFSLSDPTDTRVRMATLGGEPYEYDPA